MQTQAIGRAAGSNTTLRTGRVPTSALPSAAFSLPTPTHICYHSRCRPVLSPMTVRAVQMDAVVDAPPANAAPAAVRKVAGKTAVITGGSQGVGRELALLLSKQGYNVVLAARKPDRLEDAAQACAAASGRPDSALAVRCDVTVQSDVDALVVAAGERYERVDLVVSNAGVCLNGSLADTSIQDYHDQMEVNFMGPVAVAKSFLPALRRAGAAPLVGGPMPSLVFVNSFGGRMPIKSMSAYCASKFALAGFVDCIRPEMSACGVQVVQVHPGLINSDFLERAQFRTANGNGDEERERLSKVMSSGMPLVQTPRQVAQVVVDAVSNGSKEVMVGAPFKAIQATYNATGFNPFMV